MEFTNIIKTFDGKTLEDVIIKPLIEELTTMNKYSVLPVYSLQFMVRKIDMSPKMVLVAYDNKALITEAASLTAHLEDVMHEKTPKSITPAAVVYQDDMTYKDTILGNSDEYYYSSTYLVSGKELKDDLKNGKVVIRRVDLVSDTGKNFVKTDMLWDLVDFAKVDDMGNKTMIHPEECISYIPHTIKPLHLPFSNYTALTKSLKSIIDSIASIAIEPNSVVIEEPAVLASIVDDVKENQMIDIPNTPSVKIFKDFIKTKPNRAFVVYKKDKYSDNTVIANVFFEMFFKSSHMKVGLFYRYLDEIFNELSGIYMEEENGQQS